MTISSISSATAGSAGGSASSRIAQLMKQISKLTASIKDISQDSSLDEDTKGKQILLIQARIQMLQAQIQQIQKAEADKAQEKEMVQEQKNVENSTQSTFKVDVKV